MARDRRLSWDGCVNARDLGDLPTRGGGVTTWGAAVRSDHPSKLSADGWQALLDHGIRTVIELRTDGVDDDRPDESPRPAALTTHRIAIETTADEDFTRRWVRTNLWCTPFYFADALRRWPDRHARVVSTFADAAPGGVLLHCVRGHDRTGIVSVLLLALAGVTPEAIADDYALSDANMPERQRAELRELVAREGRSLRAAVAETVSGLEIDAYLRLGGLDDTTIGRARRRLVD